MSRITITSPDDNVTGKVDMEVKEVPIYIASSEIDNKSPEMYNYNGEQLFFVEVPFEALVNEGVDRGAEALRRVMTLAKMEGNIASGGKSYKVNPAYGVSTSEIDSFTFKMKTGETITMIPQDNQYRFYSNRGVTKILGVLENFGNAMDFVNILTFGMNSGGKKELLPVPGPLGVLNLPMKQYLNNLDEFMEKRAIQELDFAKKQGVKVVRKLINNPMYEKMRYSIESISELTVQRLLSREIKTEPEFIHAKHLDEEKNCEVLYKIAETRSDVILIIETFFFDID